MSNLSKSIPKMKNISQATNKKFETLQESLKKYEARLYNHGITRDKASPQHYPKKKQIIKTVRSHVSPFCNSKKKYKCSSLLSSSETSIDTIGNISIFDNSSDVKTIGSPVTKPRSQKRPDSFDYEAELDNCRKQNYNLQTKIENLQRKTFNSTGKKSNYRENFKDDSRTYEERPGAKVNKEDVEHEFEVMHDQIMKKVRAKHQKQLKDLENTLTERFYNELQSAQNDHEARTGKKIAEITSEYERKLSRAQEEAGWLRKQNEKLKINLEEAYSKADSVKSNPSDFITNGSIDHKRQYTELNNKYIQLQHDYIQLKKEASGLCSKCKAVTDTNNELFSKIHRLRAYLDSSS